MFRKKRQTIKETNLESTLISGKAHKEYSSQVKYNKAPDCKNAKIDANVSLRFENVEKADK